MMHPSQPSSGPSQPDGDLDRHQIGPILFFGNIPFASDWQRAQYLALGLAAHTDVVYADPNWSAWRSFRHWWNPPVAVPIPSQRLRVFTPPGGFPLARSIGLLNQVNYRHGAIALRAFLQKANLPTPRTVVTTFPDQWDALPWFPDAAVVYDIMDDHNLFLRPTQRARYERLHRCLLDRARTVTTSSQTLFQRYQNRAPCVAYIGNGIREGLVAQCAGAVADPALARLPRPRLGYVGLISAWFDFEAVRALAEAFPHGSVILVGAAEVAIPPLPPNVHLWGPVPHLSLPGILKTFDLGLIPFRRSAEIDVVNPVKLYEYCAAGLPVLSSSFTEVLRLEGMIHLYDNTPVSCVAQARQLLADLANEERRAARIAFARRNTWTELSNTLIRILRKDDSLRQAA